MVTYKTYKEAVLANGSINGVVTTCEDWTGAPWFEGKFTFETKHERPVVDNGKWKICNPADYLETLESFLASGKRLVKGDSFILMTGYVAIVEYDEEEDEYNAKSDTDSARFVLHSAADQVETLEEKEAFDAMTETAPQQVDWKNGDHCIFGAGDRSGIYVTYDAYNEGYVIYSGGEYHYVLGGDFRKPETPEGREEREREESARELHLLSNKVMAGTHMINHYSFQESKDVWLAIVDETSYRKERKQ